MSRYRNLVDEFFTKYEKPEVEELTVGFSSIDPPKIVDFSWLNHETLENLLGGDENGHYHLTKELWDEITDIVEHREYDGGFASTTEEEYLLNIDYWLDGGGAQNGR